MKTQQEILSLLAQGLEVASQEHTVTMLGDRQSYLGMSDLARGLSCPRAVIAAKLRPDEQGKPLETLLNLNRGHWLEYGVEGALSALKTKFISQLEISIDHQGGPIKAHLDLVLPDEVGQSVTVLELKSVGQLRKQVYGTHEAQLYGQLGLLHKYWHKSVFRVTDQSGHTSSKPCSFPELAHRLLGVKLAQNVDSVCIQGFVLTVSSKAAKAFGPYYPNETVLDVLLETGQNLWQRLAEIRSGETVLSEISYQQGFSPRCDWCGHNADCPKFKGTDELGLEPELAALADLKANRSSLDDQIKEREEQLKAISALMDKSGQWINGQHYRFKVATQAGRVSLDQKLLQAHLSQLNKADQNQLLAAVTAAQKSSQPFERFYLSPINQ